MTHAFSEASDDDMKISEMKTVIKQESPDNVRDFLLHQSIFCFTIVTVHT